MKKVVDAATVAHLWANQIQDEARTPNNNFYFFGNTLYSYGSHFVVAKHVTNEAGKEAVLFTERTYSNTTSTQQSIARQASRHLDLIMVPDADDTPTQNFNSFLHQIKCLAANLKRARKPEIYLTQIAQRFATAKRYADFFGYDLPVTLVEFSKITDDAGYIEIMQKEAEFQAIADKKRKEAEIKRIKETLTKWRNFEFTGYFTNNTGFDFLRFNVDKNRVETSQQIQIPAEIAKPFYNKVLDVISKGGCFNCGFKFMDYEVTQITKDFIKVGCHKIEIKEIKALTKKLGW